MAPSFRPGAILALSLAAMAVAFALPAQAGPLVDPFGHTSYNLSEWDWGLLKQSVREVLEGQQVGASIDWDDPLTGKAGRATLLDVFTRDGMRCGRGSAGRSPANSTASVSAETGVSSLAIASSVARWIVARSSGR